MAAGAGEREASPAMIAAVRIHLTRAHVYRFSIWLPLLVPALYMVLGRGLDLQPLLRHQNVVEFMAVSLVYGGVPYGLLAAWATVSTWDRSVPEIERLMYRAPLLMAGLFAALSLIVGIAVGQPRVFGALAVGGALVSLVVGYVWVCVVSLLAALLTPAGRR